MTENTYNNLGQLVKTSTTGQANALFEYDALGDHDAHLYWMQRKNE